MLNDLKTGDKEYITRELIDDKGNVYGHKYVDELLRCKDCIHWQLLTSPFGLCVWNEDNKRQMEETGFCSCGVKR